MRYGRGGEDVEGPKYDGDDVPSNHMVSRFSCSFTRFALLSLELVLLQWIESLVVDLFSAFR